MPSRLRHPDRCTSDSAGAGLVAPAPCVASKRVPTTLRRLAQKKVCTSTPQGNKINRYCEHSGVRCPPPSEVCECTMDRGRLPRQGPRSHLRTARPARILTQMQTIDAGHAHRPAIGFAQVATADGNIWRRPAGVTSTSVGARLRNATSSCLDSASEIFPSPPC